MTTMEQSPPTFNALLRGVSHRPIEVKELVKGLNDGANLIVARDPHNLYDANAIKVSEPIGDTFLGFVAKEVAAELAPWMDQGWHFTCHADGRVSTYVIWLRIEPIILGEKKEEEKLEVPAYMSDRVHDDEVPF